MKIVSYKDLLVWQNSRVLSVQIYKAFENNRDFGFKDQIQRSSISIMNNIAEGYAKRSDKGLRNYLRIAVGSAAEVESMLYIAVDLGYITTEKQGKLIQEVEILLRQLNAFINKLEI